MNEEIKQQKRTNSAVNYDCLLCAVFGHNPDFDLLIDNRLKGIDETHCKRCGQIHNTRDVIRRNWNKFHKRLHIRLIEALNNGPYKEMLRPEYRT